MLKEYLKLFGEFTKTSQSVAKIAHYLARYWIPGNLGKTIPPKEAKRGKDDMTVEVCLLYPVRTFMQ